MAKLDECLKVVLPRHLTEKQKQTLRWATMLLPDGILSVAHISEMNAVDYSQEFKDVLGTKVTPKLADFDIGVPFRGIKVSGVYNTKADYLYQKAHDLATAMQNGGFPNVIFEPQFGQNPIPDPSPEGAIWLSIGSP